MLGLIKNTQNIQKIPITQNFNYKQLYKLHSHT